MKPTLGVAMIGYMFMGRAHSQAWSSLVRAFDPSVRPRRAVLCGPEADEVAVAADRLGWSAVETDWRAAISHPDVDLVDICAPGSLHAPIAIAALEAGKHVFCEKPLALSVKEAERMTAAAEQAAARGVRSMIGFNYRRVPALSLARQLVADGRLGDVRELRASYLQDWLYEASAPWTWRVSAADSGSGALGDIGSHVIDLAQHLLGDTIVEVTGLTRTFVTRRPVPTADGRPSGEFRDVDVPDAALFLARFRRGAVGTFEATRVATGRKNSLRLELNGSLGSLAFDLERLNELEFYDGAQPVAEQGFRRILVTEPIHPFLAGWWPPGHVLGWEHAFAHELADFVRAIGADVDPLPSFRDGLAVQRVLDAVERSSTTGAWVRVGDVGPRPEVLPTEPAGVQR